MKHEIIFFYFKKYYKYIISIFVFILILFMYSKFDKKTEAKDENSLLVQEEKVDKPKVEEKYIVVDIKGAVKNPGAYKVLKGKRVYDIITTSGGLNNNADTSLINLSKKLFDEMIIVVHTKEEVKKAIKKEPYIIYLDKDCVCPDVYNDACIVDNSKNNPSSKSDSHKNDLENSESNENNLKKISLNLATLDELMTLPGIGEAKAKSIIEYREQSGFKEITDLLNVKGIGEAVFEKLKSLISI